MIVGAAIVVLYRLVHTSALTEWRGPAVAAGAGAGITLFAALGLRSANSFQLQSVSQFCSTRHLYPCVCRHPMSTSAPVPVCPHLLSLLLAVSVLLLPGAVRGGRWSGGPGPSQHPGSKNYHHWCGGECAKLTVAARDENTSFLDDPATLSCRHCRAWTLDPSVPTPTPPPVCSSCKSCWAPSASCSVPCGSEPWPVCEPTWASGLCCPVASGPCCRPWIPTPRSGCWTRWWCCRLQCVDDKPSSSHSGFTP